MTLICCTNRTSPDDFYPYHINVIVPATFYISSNVGAASRERLSTIQQDVIQYCGSAYIVKANHVHMQACVWCEQHTGGRGISLLAVRKLFINTPPVYNFKLELFFLIWVI